jgi:hypothetical protein
MSERRQARDDAAAALLDLGWQPERIALALAISRASVERLIPAPPTPPPPFLVLSGCCRRDPLGFYCDIPILWPGEVYCDTHRRPVWPT